MQSEWMVRYNLIEVANESYDKENMEANIVCAKG